VQFKRPTILPGKTPAECETPGENVHDKYKQFCFAFPGKSNVSRPMLKLFTAFLIATAAASIGHAQASATASRLGDAQIGGGFVNANSDYARSRFNGYDFYADLDFHHNFGAEVEYHYLTDGDQNTHEYQRTYEVGARYSRHFGRFQPYGKIMIGRGVQNYPYDIANLAYNIGALGGGTDIRIRRHFNARIDYEYQHWFSFRKEPYTAPNDSLTPDMLSVGFAYHF
jgi:hypothetical protein